MYRIFKNASSIFLTDQLKSIDQHAYLHWNNVKHSELWNSIDTSKNQQFYIYHSDLDEMWKEFCQLYTIIEAGGGLVKNSKGELLFIVRHGTWDLPKGKIERGESRSDAALREVKEECGLKEVELLDMVNRTYHIYLEKGQEVLKVSYWYEMYSEDRILKGQEEEGISEVHWLKPEQVNHVINHTYPNISLLVKDYLAKD